MNKGHKVATYGSLRLGHYNHASFSRDYDIQHIETKTITGWKLFSFGAYPGAIQTGNEEDKMVVDVFNVDEDCKKSMDGMELGAGYNIIDIGENEDTVHIYEHKQAREYGSYVESGDWSQYKNIEV